jgi:2-methylisocitrate lyase-like PEP mutase family enzyme
MTTQADHFRSLHARPGVLLCGNAWDVGTARLIQHVGFPAIETTSAGLSFATGRPDAAGLLTRVEMLDSAAAIVAGVSIPVSADLENGFGDSPESVAETILMAMDRGLAGGSIEDATGRPDNPQYPFEAAVDRVRAAVEAAGTGFVLTARCDGYMHGRGDLADVIRRLQAFQEAGAEVLAAPGLPDRAAVETVARALDKPLALYVGLGEWQPDLSDLAAVGVKRASVGSGLARVAMTAFLDAATEIQATGRFTAIAGARPFREMNALFRLLNGGP